MSAVTLDLDQDLLARLGDSLAEVNRTLRELAVLELYRRHAVTGSQGARLLGIDRLAFMRLASARSIPVIDSTPEQWQAELDAIEAP